MYKFLIILMNIFLIQAKFNILKVNDEEWKEFKKKYEKKFIDNNEEQNHKNTFLKNKDIIIKHNLLYQKYGPKTISWNASLNKYSDMSPEEINLKMNGFMANSKISSNEYFKPTREFKAPDELDYRKLGYVTDVKDQHYCGSCWAFSSTGSLEGLFFKVNKTLISLSEQNLLDCTRDYGNVGCRGGYMNNAFKYVKNNHGIDTEISYPYENVDTYPCRYKENEKGGEISNFVNIESKNDEALLQALVEVGPISVAIFADQNFNIYKPGVFESEYCHFDFINHAVLLVGYGTDKETGKKYWLLKNSWGTSWGEEGYIRMSRDIKNNCNISSMASFPKA